MLFRSTARTPLECRLKTPTPSLGVSTLYLLLRASRAASGFESSIMLTMTALKRSSGSSATRIYAASSRVNVNFAPANSPVLTFSHFTS